MKALQPWKTLHRVLAQLQKRRAGLVKELTVLLLPPLNQQQQRCLQQAGSHGEGGTQLEAITSSKWNSSYQTVLVTWHTEVRLQHLRSLHWMPRHHQVVGNWVEHGRGWICNRWCRRVLQGRAQAAGAPVPQDGL